MAKISDWIKNPQPIALVLIGLAISLLKIIPPISLTHDIAFFIILPPILFLGGMNLNINLLKKDWRPIALLAIPGIIASTLITGYSLSYFWHIPIICALLFGALISPTDPVSVLTIMKKIKAPERLRTILEAESLFNDGTGVILFMVIFNMIQNKESFEPGQALIQFILITAGGAFIGVICGYTINQLIKRIETPFLEVSLTAILAFGTPLIAEALHFSGVIAVVMAGIMIGTKRLTYMTLKSRNAIETFWESLDLIMNSLVFLLIGIQFQMIGIHRMIEFKTLILIGIITVLISRIIIVYPTIHGLNKISKQIIPTQWGHIIFWSGLKGTIPIILILQLPESSYRSLFLTSTFGIVLFSIIIQGLTIKSLLKRINP